MACRHVSQSRLRKPPPRWLLLIDQMSDSPVEVESQTMPDTTSTMESVQNPECGAGEAVPEDAQQDEDTQVAATQVPIT